MTNPDPPPDDDLADNEEVCGETYDHDEVVTTGPDGVTSWVCRRCGAEGWDA